MRTLALTLVPALAAALAACSPYNPDLPVTPFLCGSGTDPCPDGYKCVPTGSASVCESDDTTLSPDSGGSGTPNCSADMGLEPNNTIDTAWQMPVDTKKTFTLAGLTICPSGDIDNYGFMITTEQENAVVTMTYEASGVPLQMSILVAGGGSGATTIINGAAVPQMPGVVQASPNNLSTGQYFVQVFGPASGGTNDYELKIVISGP
jgi:hypothetical protein